MAEVGDGPEHDQIYRLTYDGSVSDQHGFVVMGGASAPVEEWLKERWREGLTLGDALILAVQALAVDPAGGRRARWPRTSSRWRCWTGTGRGGGSAASSGRCWPTCSTPRARRRTPPRPTRAFRVTTTS